MSSLPFQMVLAGVMLLFKLIEHPDLLKAFVSYNASNPRHNSEGKPIWTPFTDTIADDRLYKQLISECCNAFGVDFPDNGSVAMVARALYDRTPFEIHNYPPEFVLITQGEYENYQVAGLVRGASHKEIETAYAEFKGKMYAQSPADAPKGYGENYYNHLKAAAKAMGIESETGSFYDKMGEYFINWLVKYKHLSAVDVPLFQVTES